MVIRQLLGRKRFRDVSPVDEEDFERAKTLVNKIDAFVLLEYLHHSNVLRLLHDTIPEYYIGLNELNLVVNVHKEPYHQNDELIRLISEENKYDIKLYQYMLHKLGIYCRTS